jgi:tetratricopeptide (TPR) repeat protein
MTERRNTRLHHAIGLREAGDAETARPLLIALATELPDDAEVQYQTGWVHDRLGLEAEAVPYYERALAIGLPEPDREGLILGLGSTYRNVGRLADSLALLETGVRDYPENHAMLCFLALTRLSNGEAEEAAALLLDVILATSSSPSIDRYRRALNSYRGELRGIPEE